MIRSDWVIPTCVNRLTTGAEYEKSIVRTAQKAMVWCVCRQRSLHMLVCVSVCVVNWNQSSVVQSRSHIFQGDPYNTDVRIQTIDGVKEDVHFNIQDAFSSVQSLSHVWLLAKTDSYFLLGTVNCESILYLISSFPQTVFISKNLSSAKSRICFEMSLDY